MTGELYTIGHSNHPLERFIELLKGHNITAIGDVRSQPYSRFNPQFNRETLQKALQQHKIAYVYLGKELGARSDDPGCYVEGKVQYSRLAQTDLFQQGLDRLRKGMEMYRIALMCAEKDPLMCHRTILICRHLRVDDIELKHILEDGQLEDNRESEERLLKVLKLPQRDLFTTTAEFIELAYDIQSEKIAYAANKDSDDPTSATE
jgi:uncharacterized protein (DUF488 family)